MSMDFHAVAIPRALLEKYRGSDNLDNLYFLSEVAGDGATAYEDVEKELRDCFGKDFTKERSGDFRSLVENGELPVDELTIGREWGVLLKLFEAAPTVFGKCFAGGEPAGEDGLDVIWGDDVKLLAEGLTALEAEEELQDAVVWLRGLYSKAAENDWAVLRLFA